MFKNISFKSLILLHTDYGAFLLLWVYILLPGHTQAISWRFSPYEFCTKKDLYYSQDHLNIVTKCLKTVGNAGDTGDMGSIPGVGKISWKRMWQLTPVLMGFASEIPWTAEPGRLQSTGSQRVRHNWATEHACTAKSLYLILDTKVYLSFK